MTGKRSTYNFINIAAAAFMAMTLLWLTVSTPFVYAAQQQQQTNAKSNLADQEFPGSDDSSCNPFGNTTEEKAPGGISTFSEEYLHHNNEVFHIAELFLSHCRTHAVPEYTAFHGELLCPPPNFIHS
jgi:hypothetical protein